MKMTFRTAAALGVMLLGGLSLGVARAHAGGCGGGGASYRGGYGGGHTFARTAYYGGGGSCCSGMSMGGMRMPMMNMSGMQMPAAGMQGMNMGGYSTPAPAAPVAPAAPAAATQYFCPMHPDVVSSGPATCPYCQMALRPR